MGRRSSIKDLPPEILDAVNAAIREGATIDGIVETIRAMGGEASRSAVHRYRQSAEAAMEKMLQAREVSKVWVDRLGKEPEGEMGRMVTELIRTLAFQVTMDLTGAEGEDGAQSMDVMLLAKAQDHLSRSERAMAELTLKLRAEAVKEAADVATVVATEAGLSAEAIAEIRAKVMTGS